MGSEALQEPRFPFERSILHPPKEYAELQAKKPALTKVTLWDGSKAWLATRYDIVRELLADNQFSADPRISGYPAVSEARASVLQEEPTLIRMDPPEHTVLRRMLAPEFAVNRIAAMRPWIQTIVDQLLDSMIAKPAPVDFIKEFALPLPSIVMARLLGVPYEDHDFFQQRSRMKVALDIDPLLPLQAGREMREYLDRLLRAKERNPTPDDDILSRLVVSQIRPGNLAHDDAVQVAELLLQAGHETTANMVALGTLSLLQDRAQFEVLRSDASLVDKAVEEMLRFYTIVHFTGARVAKEDVEISGHRIRAGEGILPMISAANRDPAVFQEPDRFDIGKKMAPHLAFGFGVHQCLGQPLARLEMKVVFSTLPNRLATLRLAVPFEQLSFKTNVVVHGVNVLPVSW